MAFNWAEGDTHATDGLNNTVDDADTVGVNLDANTDDNVDDGAKPKRNRAPINVNADDNRDDGSADDAPKPKRGRGRPKKDDDQPRDAPQNNNLRRELDELRQENQRLSNMLRSCTAEKQDAEKDLELTRSSLLERESDYFELLDQFSLHEENNDSSTPKPKALVFHDKITEAIATKMESIAKFNWSRVFKKLSEIDENDGFKDVDVVFILTGADEIAASTNKLSAGSTNPFHLCQKLKRLLADMCEHAMVYVVGLPPNNNCRVNVDLFNRKLIALKNESDNDKFRLIDVKLSGSRTDLVRPDGCTPSVMCISQYEEAFRGIEAPKTIKTISATDSRQLDFSVTHILEINPDLVGRVIGRGGSTIRSITSECNVNMSFGKWNERANETREGNPESFTAVMIKGQATDVKRATELVKDVIKLNRAK